MRAPVFAVFPAVSRVFDLLEKDGVHVCDLVLKAFFGSEDA